MKKICGIRKLLQTKSTELERQTYNFNVCMPEEKDLQAFGFASDDVWMLNVGIEIQYTT